MVINPVDEKQAKWVQLFFTQYIATQAIDQVLAFHPYILKLNDTETLEVRFCYPLLPLQKITGPLEHLCVYSPWKLGKGTYGSVFPVLGHWCFKTDTARWKPKEDVIKITGQTYNNLGTLEENYDSLSTELKHGSELGYLGMRFPLQRFADRFALSMHRLPGQTLEHIINQMWDKPDMLTGTEQHQLALALLRCYYADIFLQYRLHCDIKPNNIMVDLGESDIQVWFIDWGLAHHFREGPCTYFRANPAYADPLLLDHKQHKRQLKERTAETDIYALMLCIASFYGDRARSHFTEWPDIMPQQQSPYPFQKLLANRNDFSSREREYLQDTLQAALQCDPQQRLSIETLIKRFETLLAMRQPFTQTLDDWLNRLSETNACSAEQLFHDLNRLSRSELKKIFDEPMDKIEKILTKLDHFLWLLPMELLLFLQEKGIHFSHRPHPLLHEQLSEGRLEAQQLTDLIQLGAPIPPEALDLWIQEADIDEHGFLNWTKVLKTLSSHLKMIPLYATEDWNALAPIKQRALELMIHRQNPADDAAVAWYITQTDKFHRKVPKVELAFFSLPSVGTTPLGLAIHAHIENLQTQLAYPLANLDAMETIGALIKQMNPIILTYKILGKLPSISNAPPHRGLVLRALYIRFNPLLQESHNWQDALAHFATVTVKDIATRIHYIKTLDIRFQMLQAQKPFLTSECYQSFYAKIDSLFLTLQETDLRTDELRAGIKTLERQLVAYAPPTLFSQANGDSNSLVSRKTSTLSEKENQSNYASI
ncbi:MAG: serine/threonine protein kinase [Legionellaceae bacterium]|nr:serine/threonine protein kinase [Legionellaceae bacterium]